MNANDDKLTKEELQCLIEMLSLLDDHPAEDAENPSETSVLDTLQSGLKERLQRSVAEMRARNEEVPADLLNAIQRL